MYMSLFYIKTKLFNEDRWLIYPPGRKTQKEAEEYLQNLKVRFNHDPKRRSQVVAIELKP